MGYLYFQHEFLYPNSTSLEHAEYDPLLAASLYAQSSMYHALLYELHVSHHDSKTASQGCRVSSNRPNRSSTSSWSRPFRGILHRRAIEFYRASRESLHHCDRMADLKCTEWYGQNYPTE